MTRTEGTTMTDSLAPFSPYTATCSGCGRTFRISDSALEELHVHYDSIGIVETFAETAESFEMCVSCITGREHLDEFLTEDDEILIDCANGEGVYFEAHEAHIFRDLHRAQQSAMTLGISVFCYRQTFYAWNHDICQWVTIPTA